MKPTHGGTRPNAGRKKVVKDPVKVNVTFDRPEIESLRAFEKTKEIPNYNTLLRKLVREHFGIENN